MSLETIDKITQLLNQEGIFFKPMQHVKAGRSIEVAQVRGTQVGQGAKALVCCIKGNGLKQYALAVLPADYQVDLHVLAQNLGGTRASLASPQEVLELTDCEIGAVPPFSFDSRLQLFVDKCLYQRFTEIAFNAGMLDYSIMMNVQDYRKLVVKMQGREGCFIRKS